MAEIIQSPNARGIYANDYLRQELTMSSLRRASGLAI